MIPGGAMKKVQSNACQRLVVIAASPNMQETINKICTITVANAGIGKSLLE